MLVRRTDQVVEAVVLVLAPQARRGAAIHDRTEYLPELVEGVAGFIRPLRRLEVSVRVLDP